MDEGGVEEGWTGWGASGGLVSGCRLFSAVAELARGVRYGKRNVTRSAVYRNVGAKSDGIDDGCGQVKGEIRYLI